MTLRSLNISVRGTGWIIWVYYLILLIIALSWTSRDLVEPRLVFRFTFTIAFFLPLLKYLQIAPVILTVFVTIRLFSVAPYGYLPSDPKLYLYISLILYLKYVLDGYPKNRTNIWLAFLLLIAVFSNIITYDGELPGSFKYNFIRFLIITVLLGKLLKDNSATVLFENGFVIITLCLSIYALVFYREFAIYSIVPQEIQRMYWNDPNYLGCVLAIGLVISFYNIASNTVLLLPMKILYITTIVVGLITLGLLASRGAFLTALLPVGYIIYKKKSTIKTILLLFVLIGLISLFNFNFFEPLIIRFQDDTLSTGSARTIIWENSFKRFIHSDFLTIAFGGGSNYSLHISGSSLTGELLSPHNNFLEILYDYGFSGLFIFISLLVHLVRKNIGNVLAISLIMILITSSMTLSPLMYLPFWFLIALIENQQYKVS